MRCVGRVASRHEGVAEAVGGKKRGEEEVYACCRPLSALIAARRPSPSPSPLSSLPLLRHTQMPASSPVGRRGQEGGLEDFDLFLFYSPFGGGRKPKCRGKSFFLFYFLFALGERSIRGTRMFQVGRGPSCSPAAGPWSVIRWGVMRSG